MKLIDYYNKTLSLSKQFKDVNYYTLGLLGEFGELLEATTLESKYDEAGDVYWYAIRLAHLLKVDMATIVPIQQSSRNVLFTALRLAELEKKQLRKLKEKDYTSPQQEELIKFISGFNYWFSDPKILVNSIYKQTYRNYYGKREISHDDVIVRVETLSTPDYLKIIDNLPPDLNNPDADPYKLDRAIFDILNNTDETNTD